MQYLESVIDSGLLNELKKTNYVEAFEQLKISGRNYKSGETVFFEGDVIDKFCIVKSGSIRSEKTYLNGEVHVYLGTKARPADTAWRDYSGSILGEDNGQNMVNYGLHFVGNPYRYGGTSLTNGTDCSGFIYSVYRHFGYNVPRLGFYKMGKGVCLAEACLLQRQTWTLSS